MLADRFEVAVIGGGPVGATLALELAAAGLEVALIEARAAGNAVTDERPLALSYGSRLILERLGAWSALAQATPIERIHVSQRGAFGRAVLSAREAGLPALGYVVDYARLVGALDGALDGAPVRALRGTRVTGIDHDGPRARIRYETGTGPGECAAALAVVADGSSLLETDARVRDYGQSAVTARVSVSKPHRHTAYERFTPHGPIALLPFAADYALVWTLPREEARALSAAPAQDFLDRLSERFGDRAGRFTAVGSRASHALALRVARETALPRTIVIGNAAQALHPVAGQGFNLGLRDAWELAAEVRARGPDDASLFTAYRTRRRVDRAGGVAFTDALVRLFSNDWLPLELARGAGLAVVDSLPPLKDFIVRRMVFGARG